MDRRVLPEWARAAVLLAGLALASWTSCSPTPAHGPPAAGARASGLQLIAPAGEATGPIEFRWLASSAAASYRLRFIDGREREIYTVELKETSHVLPASVLDQMETPVTYSWRVDALDGDGRVIETTRPLSFLWTK